MSTVNFTFNGQSVEAKPDETLWQIADRLNLDSIPHLCYSTEPGYRADGNCRACMVEIEGERVLAASCLRKPTEGMVVNSASQRAKTAQKMVFELLVGDQPEKKQAHDKQSRFWHWADALEIPESRFPKRAAPAADTSHPAMHVALDACIHCNLCVRACREVQVNDVIGMSGRGYAAKITFDQDDPMGQSTCVACGECVQACPTGALMETSLLNSDGVDAELELKDTPSVCPYCGVGCQINYQTHENKIVAVQGRAGPSNENRLCVKGRFGFDYINHKHRLTKPLIRLDNAPKSGDSDLDPSNPYSHFREASWDEALEKAGAGLRKIRDETGSDSLAGFGSAKCSNEEAYLFQKLVRTGFGTNNVDHCTRLCHASSVAALLEGIGSGAVTAPFSTVSHSDVIVVIGANPTVNHPVAATYFKQAAKDSTLIVMDPRGTNLKRHAKHMLQFKPGADVSMLNAMLNVIIEEELYDAEYVAKNTEGFESLKEHIVDFTPDAMSPICGIEADTLREVARIYANAKNAVIFWGMGVSQHIHGTDNCRCLIALALITGNVGREGAGLHPLRGQNNVQGASDAGLIPMMYPDYQLVEDTNVRSSFESVWKQPLDPQKGLTVVEIMHAIHDDKIKGMYIMGENPAMSDPDVQHARSALAKLDHLVVQDIFLTETAFHADVVLPASAWPEKDGTVTNTNRQIQMGQAAVTPPGDAKQDLWITNELGKQLGLDWNYDNPAMVFAEMSSNMKSLNNIAWDRVMREGSVTYPCDAEDKPGNEVVFGDGFPTANGKARLVPAEVIAPDETPDKDYPMILTTGRQLEHWHTGAMTRRARILDEIEPEAVATLSADDLERLGLTAGDMIRVETRRGSIELIARLDSAVPNGLIFIPFCYAEAAANTLTNPALDPYGKIPEFKFCAARVAINS